MVFFYTVPVGPADSRNRAAHERTTQKTAPGDVRRNGQRRGQKPARRSFLPHFPPGRIRPRTVQGPEHGPELLRDGRRRRDGQGASRAGRSRRRGVPYGHEPAAAETQHRQGLSGDPQRPGRRKQLRRRILPHRARAGGPAARGLRRLRPSGGALQPRGARRRRKHQRTEPARYGPREYADGRPRRGGRVSGGRHRPRRGVRLGVRNDAAARSVGTPAGQRHLHQQVPRRHQPLRRRPPDARKTLRHPRAGRDPLPARRAYRSRRLRGARPAPPPGRTRQGQHRCRAAAPPLEFHRFRYAGTPSRRLPLLHRFARSARRCRHRLPARVQKRDGRPGGTPPQGAGRPDRPAGRSGTHRGGHLRRLSDDGPHHPRSAPHRKRHGNDAGTGTAARRNRAGRREGHPANPVHPPRRRPHGIGLRNPHGTHRSAPRTPGGTARTPRRRNQRRLRRRELPGNLPARNRRQFPFHRPTAAPLRSTASPDGAPRRPRLQGPAVRPAGRSRAPEHRHGTALRNPKPLKTAPCGKPRRKRSIPKIS